MQRVLALFLTVLVCLCCVSVKAQSSEELYRRAYQAFERGDFEGCDSLLRPQVDGMDKEFRIVSYRLLAVSALCRDRKDEAERYAHMILTENPFYTTQMQEFPRFVDIIQKLKGGGSGSIVTASQQAETLEETPVPVTLITEEMIRRSNARNIQELLYAYVPGIVNLEGEEMNFSMRGLASYSQENVLVMINGVRQNSYSTNSAALDYRFSMGNIKQIEVLRGAASSLYGNVALTAVVNIITKTGAEVNGISVSAGGGSGHTYKAGVVMGKSLLDSDIMVWASVHGTKGYRHDFEAGNIPDGYGLEPKAGYLYINGFEGKPAYDFGLTYKWRDIQLQLNHNYGKRTYAYTNLYVPALYDYNKYETVGGITPGRGVSQTNANIRYSKSWGRWSFTGDLYGNYENVGMYNVSGDRLLMPGYIASLLYWVDPEQHPLLTTADYGVFMQQNWNDCNLGVTAKALYNYDMGRLGKGNVLFGAQFDYFDLFYNDFSVGHLYGQTIYTERNENSHVLSNNHESNMSLFVQLKHYILPSLVFNGGLRYDMKNRYNDADQNVISPRVALIWSPTPTMNYKVSYARSFVDAPYFYRASKNIYFGNEDLLPEYLNNVQLNASFAFPRVHLKWESNLFYNSAQDVIVLGDMYYENSGSVKSIGWENIVTYEHRGWMVQGNLFMQRFLTLDAISGDGSDKFAMPDVTARVNVSKSLLKDKLTLMTNLSLNGSHVSLVAPYAMRGGETVTPEETRMHMPVCFTADLGARYRLGSVDLDVKMKNITNQHYRLGGDRVPVMQEGFMVLGTLTWNIR